MAKNFSTTSKVTNEKWDLVGALVVERRPVIIKELTEIEKTFTDLLQQIEFEKSLKSDHEGDIDNIDLDGVNQQTAQDFKDMCKEELAKFNLAPRITESDKKNDLKSLDRCLDSHLLLLVEHKLGGTYNWIVPQSLHQEGEGLHETALRALEENCGGDLKVKLLGRVPWGFYKYKYPRDLREKGPVGAKVFFFKANYLSGQVKLAPKINKDFKWLESSKIFDVKPDAYSDSVSQFLLSCRR
ncbi:hypothetical protein J437_LFUL001460 [Ladona fulva]|uniref:Large ribosomal subunit protein mL46 n=1 Tax=Ladona fulva TaxID=123851 RepID=A0A8K0NUM2_LADFU|nr:hypothetical protein J437_LFUL001460 [Ladona fulva]